MRGTARRFGRTAPALVAALLLGACDGGGGPLQPPAGTISTRADSLDAAWRIDLERVEVGFTLRAGQRAVDGRARWQFSLRPGQRRPVFHFRPLGSDDALGLISAIALDGEPIAIERVRPLWIADTALVSYELPIEPGPGLHELEFHWQLPQGIGADGLFRTRVDDSIGLGNERLWPTINAAGELARHRLQIDVLGAEQWLAVGSGETELSETAGGQRFVLDTLSAVPAYQVMFALAPAGRARLSEFQAGAVPVAMLSTLGDREVAAAIDLSTRMLATLASDFGPYAPPALAILLIDWDTGMEYYGATITGPGALAHELTHLWIGTGLRFAPWRDTWLDEAINVWWNTAARPVAADFRSDLLGGRPLLSPGFDPRAYGQGARVIAAVAAEVGAAPLTGFLAALYRERSLPLSTEDFVQALIDWHGDERWRARFEQWVGLPASR